MNTAIWFLVVGALLLFMAVTAGRLKRLPLSTAIVYLCVGMVLGPTFTNQFHFNPIDNAPVLEIITEIAVLISLFGAGLKLAAPVGDRLWWLPFRLATVSMVATVGLTAVAGVLLLDLPIGAAVLLGAILAPTDPVLATDVQVKGPGDDNRLRFALTGEAGLNDGTAFPMVMLGLGLLGLHDLGGHFERWLLVDVLWATTAGVVVGGVLGATAAWLIHRLEKHGIHSEFTEDFLGLGLIALAYGISLLVLGYGFLAVFAAGFMLHRTEARLAVTPRSDRIPIATSSLISVPADAVPGHMSRVSLIFIEQLGRIAEVILLLLVGGMLFADSWQWNYIVVALLLLFVVRPLAVMVGLAGSPGSATTKAAIGWFGVRGIGSFYYLMYAIQHGLDQETAVRLVSIVLVVVTLSILVHGASVTPLMRMYGNRKRSVSGGESG